MSDISGLTRSIAGYTSTALKILGTVLLFVPGGQLVAAGAIASSVAIDVGMAISARPPRSRDLNSSPHYGADRLSNPLPDDTPIPLLYGTHRIVPILLQEYLSPLAETQAGLVKKQGYSALYAVCMGEVKATGGIRDIKVNEQPLFSDEIVDNFTGNGTKVNWSLSGTHAYLGGLTVTVDGVAKANVETDDETAFTEGPSSRTVPAIVGSGTRTEYFVRITRPKGDRILMRNLSLTINGTARERASSVAPWTARRVTHRKVDIVFLGETPPSATSRIVVSFIYIAAGDCALRQTGRGQTTIEFPTAPSNGAKIVATYRTSFIPRLKFDWRPGTLDQEPLEGFRDAASTEGVALTLPKGTDREYDSVKPVDDIRIGIVAPAGLVKFSSDGSGTEPALVKIAVRYRTVDASGTDHVGGWKTLYHLGAADKPSAIFNLWGMATGRRNWEISIRETLQELLDAGFTDFGEIDDIEAEIESLTNTRLKVQVTRKNAVQQDGNDNVIDGVLFSYATKVNRDAPLSYPGVTLFSIRGMLSEQFSGSSPFVTCIAERADLYNFRDGGEGRSSNAGLALYDLITSARNTANLRYGGGHWYTEDDIDLDTLTAVADRCDETVVEADGSTGLRSVLNLVVDTPMSLSEVLADIAYTAGAFTVQQGLRWRFPLDLDEEEDPFSFVDSTSPALANIVAGSLEVSQDPLESLPTDLELEFFNEAKEYQRESIVVVVSPASATRAEGLAGGSLLGVGTARNPLRVSGIGITRLGEATRRADEVLQRARNASSYKTPGDGPSLVTWLAHPGALLPEAGDVVAVTSTVPGASAAFGWSGQRVRVIAVGRESGTPGEDGAPAMPLVRYFGRTIGAEAHKTIPTRLMPGNEAGQPLGGGTSGGAYGLPSRSAGSGWGRDRGSSSISMRRAS